MTAPSFLDPLEKFWADEAFDPAHETLLLAVSGGCDSTAMLELFHREIAPKRNGRLHVLHVNHRLRPAAEADRDFVRDLCRERNIPFYEETLDPATRPVGQSPEMWGREQRYAAYARVQKLCGARFVLTAHHRDDVVETLCLRLERGTGFSGLASIPFRRAEVVRPVLCVGHAELESWLQSLGMPWREDESNADVGIPRNWMRHRLLPAWRETEPGLDARLFGIARSVSNLLPAWEKWLDREFPAEEVIRQGGIPLKWLEDDGTGVDLLRRRLPMLGIDKPLPEFIAEILRQSRLSPDRMQIRAGGSLAVIGKRGILVSTQNETGKPRDARNGPFTQAKTKPGTGPGRH